jgi:tRNA(Ile)-lysidine synthase
MLIEQAVASALENGLDSALKAITKQPAPCIWIGLSAGVDSTALLHAAAKYCSLSGRNLTAIHVHHGLSKNADTWAKQANKLCEELSQKFSITIGCIVEKLSLNHDGESLEQAARSARYAIFSKYCQPNDVLLQGHHLDDQIETFFMRAIRGSGLTGLASIPKQRPLSRDNHCQILRPLLAIEKTKLIEYAKKHQLHWVEDESNLDSKMDRNWWRNELLPQIWQRYPEQKKSLSRTINNVQHEQALLQALIIDKLASESDQQLSETKIHPALSDIPSFDLSLIQRLEQPTSLSYLRAWLAQYVDILPSTVQMQIIYAEMIHARADSEPKVSWATSCLYRHQGYLYLLSTKSDQMGEACLVVDELVDWRGESFSVLGGYLECIEKSDGFVLKPSDYGIRCWKAGDTAKPSGRSTRKLKKWWQDYNVPSWARQQWPIIVNKKTDEIAAIPGLFICQGYSVNQDQSGWQVSYRLSKI